MANPKHKTPKAKTGSRRSQWKLSLPAISECPRCRQPKCLIGYVLIADTTKI